MRLSFCSLRNMLSSISVWVIKSISQRSNYINDSCKAVALTAAAYATQYQKVTALTAIVRSLSTIDKLMIDVGRTDDLR